MSKSAYNSDVNWNVSTARTGTSERHRLQVCVG